MTVQAQVPTGASAPHVQVPLCDLGLAPENLRFHEPEDDEVRRLAETIRAAGVIYPPIVRKGRKGESAYMVLDGRRRRFALLRLAAAGAIAPDSPIDCILAGDKAFQTAAAILPNAEHAPVHPADVIAAIGKLRKARLTTAQIAAALGYDELEVKRLEAVSGVHADVLRAFRMGRLSLRQVRLFARLKDRTRQAELAQQALAGYFHEHGLQMLVTRGRVTVEDERFALVTQDAYIAVGGRLGADLFGELPAEVLDPDRLEDLWRAAALRIGRGLATEGLELSVSRERGLRAPDGLAHMPFVYEAGLTPDARAQLDAARERNTAAEEAVAASAADALEAAIAESLAAQLALARLEAGTGEVTAAMLTPRAGGLIAEFFQRPAPADPAECGADADADGEDEEDRSGTGERTPWRPQVFVPESAPVEGGITNQQHAARTDMATRGLAADLAGSPGTALIAITAQLFKQLALTDPVDRDASALRIAVQGSRSDEARPGLDGEPWTRLGLRRADYLEAGGGRPIAYVAGLAGDDLLALLADLVAVTLDLRETRPTALRRAARAEAEELAALCKADLSRRWTPDAAFLALHARRQLLGFLADMGATAPRKPLKKDEFVRLVVEAAAKRRWLPACLRWGLAPPVEAPVVDEPRDGGIAPIEEAGDPATTAQAA